MAPPEDPTQLGDGEHSHHAVGLRGGTLSFAQTLAQSIANTAVSRILLAMARDGVCHASNGKAHETNATPHIAATLSAAVPCSSRSR
jgi:hypothetical protein